MKTILVTGADGFIGSHLTEMLVDKGYQVKALSQYNSFNNWGCMCSGLTNLDTKIAL
jgi:nucleoside-diphosphate-sugar epimerase